MINSVTGDPVAHALVVLGEYSRLMLTGSDGRFQFSGLAAPTEMVFSEKPGFFDQRWTQIKNSLTVNLLGDGGKELENFIKNLLTVSGDAGPVVIKLVPEGIITGRVQDSNGHPVRGAYISVEGPDIRDGRRYWEEKARAISDEEGNFRVAGLVEGAYYVAVRPERESSSLGNRSVSARLGLPIVVYYPSSPDRDSATQVKIAPGDLVELQFNLKLQPLFKVSGEILGGNSGERNPLRVFDSEKSPLSLPLISVLPNGTFEIRQIPPGKYWLRAEKEGYTETAVNVTRDLEGIRLQMLQNVTIPIHVTGGPPIPDAPAPPAEESDAQGRKRMFSLLGHGYGTASTGPVQVDFVPLDGWTTGETHDNEAGTVSLYSGRYHVSVASTLRDYYIASARCGGTDLLRENLVLQPGVQPKPIEVLLRDDGATLAVDVPGVHFQYSVLLVPENAPEDVIEARISPQGDLTIPNVPPGDYQVFAFASVEQLEFRSPEVMAKYSSQAVRINLNARQKKSLTLPLIRGEE